MKTQDKLEKIKALSDRVSKLSEVLSKLGGDDVEILIYRRGKDRNVYNIENFSLKKDDFCAYTSRNYIFQLQLELKKTIHDLILLLQLENSELNKI